MGLISAGTQLSILNSVFRECGGGGQGLAAGSVPSQQTIDVDGLVIQNTSTGLSLGSNVSATLRNLDVQGNILGVFADASSAPCTVSLHNSKISHNFIGVETGGGTPTIRLDNDIITVNNTGLQLGGGTIVSFGNNVISFNGLDGSPNGSAALR